MHTFYFDKTVLFNFKLECKTTSQSSASANDAWPKRTCYRSGFHISVFVSAWFHCSTWWQRQVMNEGGYRGEHIGYVVGTMQQTVQRPLLTWSLTFTSALQPDTYRCVFPLGQPETLYQSLSFPCWACVTQMVGILHGRWNIRFTSLCTASNRAQPLWHLWTARPCRKRQTCFWRSELQLIPPNSAARHTHDNSWVSFSHLNPPFAQSTGGRVLRLPSVVAAKKCPVQINTFTVPLSGGKKPWHVSSCLSLASS